MATILRILPKCQAISWAKSAVCASAVRCKTSTREAPIVDTAAVIARPEEKDQKQKLSGHISVPKQVNVGPISGIPDEHIKERRVRIYIPSKNAMQSGTNNVHNWQIEFDNRERWENPLMGWSSTGDPLSNMQIDFSSKEAAIEHCERHGYRWFVDADEQVKKPRNKNYGVNFSWDKRTRVSTK